MHCSWPVMTDDVGGDVVMKILMILDDVLLMMDDDSRIEMQLRRTYDTESICVVDHLKGIGCSFPSLL